MEYIERTEIAGNVIPNNNKNMEDNIMEANSNLTVTIPMKSVIEALAKDDAVVTVIYDKMKDDVESLVNSNLTDGIESAIDDKMTDFVREDDIWDKIQYDVERAVEEGSSSGITEDWIKDELSTYSNTPGYNLCQLGIEVWNAIIHTIGNDISMNLDKVKNGTIDEPKITDKLDSAVLDLIKLIRVVSEQVTMKVIEEEKQKYLSNKQEYLQNDNEISITVDQFKTFVQSLSFIPAAKQYILDEFEKITINFKK